MLRIPPISTGIRSRERSKIHGAVVRWASRVTKDCQRAKGFDDIIRIFDGDSHIILRPTGRFGQTTGARGGAAQARAFIEMV
jgi:hypothetical protein